MSYRVIFVPAAHRDLVDLWLESDFQREMTLAIDDLVRQLESDASHVGESRQHSRRIALAWPVGIEFDVDTARQLVFIIHLWTFRKRET